MRQREKTIEEYIAAYNTFAVQKMIENFSDEIVFENIQAGEVTMRLEGLKAFEKQAEEVKGLFSERQQTIIKIIHREAETEIEINYFGVIAKDLPNGMKKGQEIKLKGKSIFEFKGSKIVKLIDIS
ncbi:nuclear transport factor 2 family protein [Lunatibacter salilacus]|uniref:nuclear transport factor 2 family protein n=1 Tax=Lunatibacter salilacus TaxID=2483804 RepID=UPI00131AD570|nr:nuclear transport factor 2 family protein [Lunatibacter salilacus]